LAEYLKTHRLLPQEVQAIEQAQATGQPLSQAMAQRIRLVLAEGILGPDLKTVDDDALKGTLGQLLFRWIREEFNGSEILHVCPARLTETSKAGGIDHFELLGDPALESSLRFIVWEVKATDSAVSGRIADIYKFHKGRVARLLRGLQFELSEQYPVESQPVLGRFVQHLLDHWLNDDPCKGIGGAVIYDSSHRPGNVFTAFHTQFPNLASSQCRQVILVEVPRFRKTRRKLWTYLKRQIS
jgi:hypothetical protein